MSSMVQPTVITTHRLVKSSDLNHHGTLYAGRTAEWFVEAGFIAAASLTSPDSTVCLKIHGMEFRRPVQSGEIVRFESKVVDAGRTSLTVCVRVFAQGQQMVQGFLTFVHVDAEGKPSPHDLVISPVTPEDLALQETARQLKK
jgi:acyl-CoA hydrolase